HWALLSRQAMTDMSFVTPMTVAMAFAGMALLLPKEEVLCALPRRSGRVGRLVLSWPGDRAVYGVAGLYVACVLPQLILYCVQLGPVSYRLGRHVFTTYGPVTVVPWVLGFMASLWWMARARDRRSIYLWVAY